MRHILVNIIIDYAWETFCCVFGEFFLTTRLLEHGVSAVLRDPPYVVISMENVILAISCKVGGSGICP